MLIGFTFSYFCPPSKNSGASVKFRPSPWVFRIIWPILYFLLGFAWINSLEYSFLYFIFNIILNLWLVFYSCKNDKITGIYIILLSLLILLYILINVKKNVKYYLIPLFIWLLFALLLNTFEVQSK